MQEMKTAAEISRSYGANIIVRRLLATLIDYSLLILICFVCFQVTTLLSDDVQMAVCLLVFPLVLGSYYLLLEGLTGITIGKLLAGIRVVDDDGVTPEFLQMTVRTVLRVVEVNPLLCAGLDNTKALESSTANLKSITSTKTEDNTANTE